MRLLTQGFETQTTQGLLGGASEYIPGRINGVACYTGNLTYQVTNRNEIFTRFAYAMRVVASGGAENATRFHIRDSQGRSRIRVNFGVNQPLTVFVDRPNTNNLPFDASYSTLMMMGWYLFEAHYWFTEDVNGVKHNFELKLDGVKIITLLDFPARLTPPTMGTQLSLDYGSGVRSHLDDIAINDTTGNHDNSWCGDGHVIALKPDGNGDLSQFTRSDGNTGNNFQLVDEIPANVADYVESSAIGATDLYTSTNPTPVLKPDDVVKRVWVSATGRQLNANGGQVSLGVKVGANAPIWSSPLVLDTDFREKRSEDLLTDHGGSINQQDLNNLQVGIKVEPPVS